MIEYFHTSNSSCEKIVCYSSIVPKDSINFCLTEIDTIKIETDAKKWHTPYNIPLLKNPYFLSDLHETWSK